MTRLTLALLAFALTGCFESHAPNEQAIRGDDCVMCHRTQYDQTGTEVPYLDAPDHNQFYPTTCANCHSTTDWGALHPKPPAFPDTFIIDSGPHAPIACETCHDAAIPNLVAQGKRGSNTNCTQTGCHPNSAELAGEHVGAMSPTGAPYVWSDTQKNFCLTCHPTGFGGKHPEDKFPISRGRHSDIACATCHSEPGPSKAGENTNCIQCHPANRYNGEHDEVGGYTQARDNPTRPITRENFCVKCHKDGRGGD